MTVSSAKIQFIGGVEDGKLKLSYRKDFDQALKQFEGKRVEGFLWKARKRRSVRQNSYLWGLVYPALLHGFKDMGHDGLCIEDVHEFCKKRFINESLEIVSPHSGEQIVMDKTTTELTTSGMMDYLESIKRFAAEFLAISIPDPIGIFQNESE